MSFLVGFIFSSAGVALLVAVFGWFDQRRTERAPRRRVDAIKAANDALAVVTSDTAREALEAQIETESKKLLASLQPREVKRSGERSKVFYRVGYSLALAAGIASLGASLLQLLQLSP